MNLILFNGPPRVGKDTAAAQMSQIITTRKQSVRHEKFSAPIKRAFAGTLNTSIEGFNVPDFEPTKEDNIPWLRCSYREWQITFSEQFMKPCFGNNVFVRLFLKRIIESTTYPDYVVVSDCGFQVELDFVEKQEFFSHIMLIRLHREGCTFTNDSREWVGLSENSRHNEYSYTNNNSLAELDEWLRFTLTTWGH